MNRAMGWRAAALALIVGLAVTLVAKEKTPGEYAVKAAFLCNFITFTEWPSAAFENPGSPIVIGVLGRDPFGSALDATMTGGRLKDRPLIVWHITRLEDMNRCHVLFISDSESNQIGEILRRLKNQPVLTVSDMAGFAEAGGAVAFTTAGSVRLTINPVAAQSAGLTLSAKLLRLARTVEPQASVQ